MTRRRSILLFGMGASLVAAGRSRGQSSDSRRTLLDIPLQVLGDWGQSSLRDVAAVVSRVRATCLSRVRILSDRQPVRLRVENRSSGNPAIWLHGAESTSAWIIVNVGAQDWSKLAYQFGHELGHVLANSWDVNSRPSNPCQWLEETLVEAFSLRGMGRLADSWEQRPIFPNDAAFASAIRQYRQNVVGGYEKTASDQMAGFQIDKWFRQYRSSLEGNGGSGGRSEAAVPAILRELEEDPRYIEDLAALNRWRQRSAVPIEQYLDLWKKSCDEIGVIGQLPGRVRDLLGLA